MFSNFKKFKIYDKTINDYVENLENENEIVVFDVFLNEFKVFDKENKTFKDLNFEKYEIRTCIGQQDVDGIEICEDDILYLGNGLFGIVRYYEEMGSFQVFYELNEEERDIYSDFIDTDDYKKVVKKI